MKPHQLQRVLWIYVIIAALSLYSTLWLPYVGEEGVYTIGVLEMLHSHQWLSATLMGVFYGRPPLMSWLMIPLVKLFGVAYVLEINRFIVATATIASGVVMYYGLRYLSKSALFALLALVVYFTGDTLMRHGWLAYSDPLLGFFTLCSIMALWLSLDQRSYLWMLLACAMVIASFLCKSLTSYQFFAVAGLVLLWRHPQRWFLFRPLNIIIYAITIAFPWLFTAFAGQPYMTSMLATLLSTSFAPPTVTAYLYQVVIDQPLMLLLRLMPFSVLACYSYWRSDAHTEIGKSVAMIAIAIALINFAIVWFGPVWPEARYYLPVYPLFATFMAYLLLNSNGLSMKALRVVLIALLVLKALFVMYFYYFHESVQYRPDFTSQAQRYLHLSRGYPLYVSPGAKDSAPVNSLVARIDQYQWPKKPLSVNGNIAWDNAFMITINPLADSQEVAKFLFRNTYVYLYCRGKACQSAK